MQETRSSTAMSTSLLRLAALVKEFPQQCFTHLNHYLTVDLLRAAFQQILQGGIILYFRQRLS